jgi:predicted nucleic-acid-binding Zn-ribbon protein
MPGRTKYCPKCNPKWYPWEKAMITLYSRFNRRYTKIGYRCPHCGYIELLEEVVTPSGPGNVSQGWLSQLRDIKVVTPSGPELSQNNGSAIRGEEP